MTPMTGFNVKAVATDIDGTLTDRSYKLSLKAVEALRLLESDGIPVILVSGNAYPLVKVLQIYLGCSGAVVCEGGAVVEYRGTIRILSSKDRALDALRRLKEVYGDRIVESWCNEYRLVDVALDRTISREEVYRVLKDYTDLRLWDSGFAYHILERGIDKGLGLKVAADLMGIGVEDIVAVGDSENDVPMFRVAGFSIAVGDASDDVKRNASLTVHGSNGEGFAEAVNLILAMEKR
ncbi:MAG: phosphoglycolate phosphatase [Candidatus Bathyarchaeota archaeon]|nr:phosphoglycolate phosphatase [Candidatus Bathyarchaeota archaeon]